MGGCRSKQTTKLVYIQASTKALAPIQVEPTIWVVVHNVAGEAVCTLQAGSSTRVRDLQKDVGFEVGASYYHVDVLFEGSVLEPQHLLMDCVALPITDAEALSLTYVQRLPLIPEGAVVLLEPRSILQQQGNRPTFVEEFGGGVEFRSSMQQWTAIPYVKSTDMTVCVWARSTKDVWSQHGIIASDREVSGFILHPRAGCRLFGFYLLENVHRRHQLIGQVEVDDVTKPHFYVMSANEDLSVAYFDGSQVAERRTRSARPADVRGRMYIGRDDYGERYGDCVIYNLQYYSRMLASAEVLDLFESQHARFS
mmetsp:Transcript_55398/g.154333  ORF Transcript_55398/g.154333 Transcript_55398/m.154333 type:complete len:310 (-) Transcript_55398:199-1128(-)